LTRTTDKNKTIFFHSSDQV